MIQKRKGSFDELGWPACGPDIVSLTFHQRFAKDGRVSVDGGAVPPVLAELELALFDSGGGTFSHLHHVIRMLLAESPLFTFHARDVVAVHPRIGCRAQLKFAEEPEEEKKRKKKGLLIY